MPRVGLTQRVTEIEAYTERRDCLDQEWTVLLEDLDLTPIPLPNCVEAVDAYLDDLSLDAVVLTGGNDLDVVDQPDQPAPERDRFEEALLEFAIGDGVPVLGVCRGLQLLTTFFGGSITPVEEHVATTHEVEVLQPDLDPDHPGLELSRAAGPGKIEVNSYHDYGIAPSDVPDTFEILATASDGTVEALCHPDHSIVAIMWHPERQGPSTTIDRQLLGAVLGGTDQ